MLASSLATPYVNELDTMGLRGVPTLWILGRPLNFWGDCTCGVNLAICCVLKSSCLFDVPQYANEFVS